jgi:hypothetical protein
MAHSQAGIRNRLAFSKIDDFATPGINYGLTWCSLIEDGSASSWRSTTNFDESRPWIV